jgi:hypothetical protein
MNRRMRRGKRGTAIATLGAALLIGALVPAAWAATLPRFVVPSIALTVGVLPQEIAVGDFNGDGHTDGALANQGPQAFKGGIATALGDGAGAFGSVVTTTLPAGWGACDVASADFNEDGKVDLAAEGCTTSGSGPLFLLLGTGTGAFTVGQQITSSVDVQLVAADFDGDGHADLASSENGGVGKVKVYLGTGTGTVGSASTYSGGFDSWDLVVSDLNVDGHPDLVGASGGAPWTRLNQGDGTFGSQIYDPISTLFGIRLAVADYSGDGKPDVAVVDASGGNVNVGLGLGNGHFTAKQVVSDVSSQTNWVAAGDFTGDGKLDVVADGDSNTVVLLKGRGDGTFGTITRWMTGSEGLVAADLDGAGSADLVSFTADPGTLYGTLATGGRFRAPTVIPSGVFGQSVSGDVNGDGRLDLVRPGVRVGQGKLQSVVVTQLGKGAGRFGPPVYSPIRKETASSGPVQMRLGDVNEDGILDAVGGFDNVLPSSSNLFAMLGTGTGTFGVATLMSSGDSNADVDALDMADVTGDGHLDIVSNTVSQLSVKPGVGDGTFGAPILSGRGSSGTKPQTATLVGDFTGEGTPDVVAVITTGNENIAGSDVVLQQGQGDGTFAVIQTIHIDSNSATSDLADLNGDGRPDVAVEGMAGFDAGRYGLFVFLTQPSGTLGTPVYLPRGFGALVISDVNLDGSPDILTDGILRIEVNLNDGSGGFDQLMLLPAGGDPSLAADFTGDGKPDLTSDLGTFPTSFALYVNTTP